MACNNYGIRPEHIELDEGGFLSEVELIEPTGAETLIFIKLVALNFAYAL